MSLAIPSNCGEQVKFLEALEYLCVSLTIFYDV